jgi:hypothetical protein
VSLGSLIISDMTNLHSPQESKVPPTEPESEVSVMIFFFETGAKALPHLFN